MNRIVMTNEHGIAKYATIGRRLDGMTILEIYRDMLLADGYQVSSRFSEDGRLIQLTATRGREFYTVKMESEPVVVKPAFNSRAILAGYADGLDDVTPLYPRRWLLNVETGEEKLVITGSPEEAALLGEGWREHRPERRGA